jgi:hypothetical protein
MQENTDSAQLELLAKIYNQLIDIKKILVETELARPGATSDLKTKLQEIVGGDKPVDSARPGGGVQQRQHQLIAPTDTHITPGESKDEAHKAGER